MKISYPWSKTSTGFRILTNSGSLKLQIPTLHRNFGEERNGASFKQTSKRAFTGELSTLTGFPQGQFLTPKMLPWLGVYRILFHGSLLNSPRDRQPLEGRIRVMQSLLSQSPLETGTADTPSTCNLLA